jgi:hypothetical protein
MKPGRSGFWENTVGYGHAQDWVSDAGQGRGCDSVAPRRATMSHSCPIAPGRAVPRVAGGGMGTGDAGRGRAWRRPAHPDASWGRPEPATYFCAGTWSARTSPEPGISPESGRGPGSGAPLPAPASRVTGQAQGRPGPGSGAPLSAPASRVTGQARARLRRTTARTGVTGHRAGPGPTRPGSGAPLPAPASRVTGQARGRPGPGSGAPLSAPASRVTGQARGRPGQAPVHHCPHRHHE